MLAELMDLLHMARPVIGAGLMLTGGLLALIGTIGVLRFPDFYTRLHAASVTDTSAATLALIGMALMAPGPVVLFKLAIVWVFLFVTGPTSSHAVANAAHVAGLEPRIGRVNTSEAAEADA